MNAVLCMAARAYILHQKGVLWKPVKLIVTPRCLNSIDMYGKKLCRLRKKHSTGTFYKYSRPMAS